jgi:hypothetical protein
MLLFVRYCNQTCVLHWQWIPIFTTGLSVPTNCRRWDCTALAYTCHGTDVLLLCNPSNRSLEYAVYCINKQIPMLLCLKPFLYSPNLSNTRPNLLCDSPNLCCLYDETTICSTNSSTQLQEPFLYKTYGTNAFTALCVRTAKEDCQRPLFNLATSAGAGTSVGSACL